MSFPYLRAVSELGHECEPFEESVDSIEIIGRDSVRYTIIMHDLNSSQLVVARVHITTKNL